MPCNLDGIDSTVVNTLRHARHWYLIARQQVWHTNFNLLSIITIHKFYNSGSRGSMFYISAKNGGCLAVLNHRKSGHQWISVEATVAAVIGSGANGKILKDSNGRV